MFDVKLLVPLSVQPLKRQLEAQALPESRRSASAPQKPSSETLASCKREVPADLHGSLGLWRLPGSRFKDLQSCGVVRGFISRPFPKPATVQDIAYGLSSCKFRSPKLDNRPSHRPSSDAGPWEFAGRFCEASQAVCLRRSWELVVPETPKRPYIHMFTKVAS